MPQNDTELVFHNPYELLVSVALSAQCTDKRINLVTPTLFQKYPSPQELAQANVADVLHIISSVSYPNSKAKHLVAAAKTIVERFHGEVPREERDLLQLAGVGRKTANVIRALAFGEPTLAVDTHVFRVSHRLGLVSEKDNTPDKVERTLLRFIPKEKVSRSHFWLLYLGRYTCMSRKPLCETCELTVCCSYFLKKQKREKAMDQQSDKTFSLRVKESGNE